ncbi:MAG TPA: glycosyltransferase family 2 protein [Anaerolineales bacterium]|nr:glycosyltransferase family 2 protein [Anaerolineales bacterium]
MSDEIHPSVNEPLKTISIVIVNWNTRELLGKCLTSIYSSMPSGELEIWVVDNASTDNSCEMVKQLFPAVNIIENQTNTGFAQANNQAVQCSNAKFVLLLNPDTELMPGALEKLVSFIQASPRTGAVGPRTLNPDKSLQTSCFPTPTLSREFWRLFHLDKFRTFGVYDMERWETHSGRKVDILLGACLLIRKEALDEVGLLSEEYFMYTEEVDICYRLGQRGWELYWIPEAEIIHYGGQSTRQVSRQMFIHLYQSKLLFFKKHHGNVSAFLYKLILLFASLVRLSLTPIAYLSRSSLREKRLELAHNYSQLVKTLLTN